MKKKQIKNLAIALSLTVALGTGATLALLTAQTKEVTNTFTVGKNLTSDDILLNEADLQEDGRTADDSKKRVQALEFKNLMQGDEMDKDPTVQINPEAAKCYMFIHVTGLDELDEVGVTVNIDDKQWAKADEKSTLNGYYYYKGTGTENEVLDPSSAALPDNKGHDKNDGLGLKDLDPLFTKVTVADDAKLYDTKTGESVKLENIVVKACAVQAQNVATWKDALGKLPAGFGPETTTTTTTTTPEGSETP